MIPLPPALSALLVKAALVAGVLLAAAAGGALAMHSHDQKRYDALLKESAVFKGGVETAFADYEAQRKAREAQEQADKEKADAKHKVDLAAARADTERVRHERDAARSSFLSKAPPGSVCPDGQVCFTADAFGAAYRVLTADLRGVADSCTSVELALQTAREWAQGGN